jgi:hypothetical protein
VHLQGAEVYYADGGDWEGAVNMYRGNDLWEDAYRVAKFNGGVTAGNRVAYAWALSVGGEAGSKLLTKLVCPSCLVEARKLFLYLFTSFLWSSVAGPSERSDHVRD